MRKKAMNNPTCFKTYQAIKIVVAAVAVILIAGCASTPAPNEQMAVSRAAISDASSAGANEFAPLEFKSAVDKMDAAERAMAKKDYELAGKLAEQAQADAQLAVAVTRTAKANKAANTVQESNRVLRDEIERKAK
jgi:hypothetical protein